jgi:uncharacterized protein (DUF1800 family)
MPLTPYSGSLGRKAAAHLLRRATFGANKQDIDTFSTLTAAAAVAQLFQSSPLPSAPVLPGGTSWVTQAPAPTEDENDLQHYLICWWLGVILNTGVSSTDKLAFSTREKTTFLLHTILTTIQETVGNSRSLYFQNALLRNFAFDDVADPKITLRELTKKICVDNAMLALLDGRLNVKGNPNENYARELMELYTIGKGLNDQIPATGVPGDYFYYTEQDVVAAAKVLSGYDIDDTFTTIDADTLLPRGKVKAGANLLPNQHDNTVKQFSARFSNATVTPNPTLLNGGQPTEASMLDEIDQLINIIYAQTETPKNICRKIYRFYVYHDISAAIDSSIVDNMASTFTSNNFKIEPVIKELLQSQHFYDSMDATVDNDNFGAIIKSPLDLVAGTLNFFEYQLPDYVSQPASFYMKAGNLLSSINDQGMNLMNPYDVAGYEAYHQFPLYHRMWINTNALTQRYKFIYDTMTVDNMDPDNVTIDLLAYMQSRFSTNAMDPDAFIREIVSYILPLSTEGSEITTQRLDWFKAQLYKLGQALPQGPLAFWQFSWTNANSIPASGEDTRGMLQDMVNAMMQSPEYQLS